MRKQDDNSPEYVIEITAEAVIHAYGDNAIKELEKMVNERILDGKDMGKTNFIRKVVEKVKEIQQIRNN